MLLLTRIKKQILRLNVSVANPLRVYVGEAPEQLVHVQLDEGGRDRLLALAVLPRHLVHRLGDELQHEVLRCGNVMMDSVGFVKFINWKTVQYILIMF